MRITGSLFTHTEMSASIADSTFLRVSGSILTSSDFCVTVQEAMGTIKIAPILGSGLRCPFYHELIPSASIPPPPTGSSGTAYMTYRFNNNDMHPDRQVLFAIQIQSGSNYSYLEYTSNDVPFTVVDLPAGVFVTAYLSFVPIGSANCTNVSMSLKFIEDDIVLYNSTECPSIVMQDYEVYANMNYILLGDITNMIS